MSRKTFHYIKSSLQQASIVFFIRASYDKSFHFTCKSDTEMYANQFKEESRQQDTKSEIDQSKPLLLFKATNQNYANEL